MQTLIFNTETKEVKLLEGARDRSLVLETFNNVSTVKMETNYYEIMKKTSVGEDTKTFPVMRVPISNTNMILIHEK
jgi:hypothetical protein